MEQLNRFAAFPSYVYSIEKPEFLGPVRAAVEDARTGPVALDEVHPIRMGASIHEHPRVQDFAAYVAITAGNVLADQGYALEGLGAYFMSMWEQEHHKGSDMPAHVHGDGAQIVGFYFFDVPPGSSVMTFSDPRPGKVQTGLAERDGSIVTDASYAFHMEPREGLLVFTNAWLPHALTRHRGARPLRFLHFNIGLAEHPTEAAEVI